MGQKGIKIRLFSLFLRPSNSKFCKFTGLSSSENNSIENILSKTGFFLKLTWCMWCIDDQSSFRVIDGEYRSAIALLVFV